MRKVESRILICEGHPSGCSGSAYWVRALRNLYSRVDSIGSNMVQYQHLTKVSSQLRSASEDECLNLTRGRSAAWRARFNVRLSAPSALLDFSTPPPSCN